MRSKNATKNSREPAIQADISTIYSTKRSGLRPYSELFSYCPTNITQQNLGSLFGFFRINDYSDDSAYIVNFLSSVLKKEYYLNPRRSTEDSFDTALHKINLALSELAKNGNIMWIGKLDAAICVISGNNFYFSTAGKAQVIILRDGLLSNISEGLSENEEEPHPIKTFTNVSSGPLKSQDKIIITAENIFEVLSFEEIKKNSLRFPPGKFYQFLKTALVNELDSVQTIIVDISEKEKTSKRKSQSVEISKKDFNVFSAKTFSGQKKQVESEVLKVNLKEEIAQAESFVDEKTGHIYLRGTEKKDADENRFQATVVTVKETAEDWLITLKEKIFFFPKVIRIKGKINYSSPWHSCFAYLVFSKKNLSTRR